MNALSQKQITRLRGFILQALHIVHPLAHDPDEVFFGIRLNPEFRDLDRKVFDSEMERLTELGFAEKQTDPMNGTVKHYRCTEKARVWLVENAIIS
jgi:hypothetical protein